VQRLMRLMGIESVAPKPDTSRPVKWTPSFGPRTGFRKRGISISAVVVSL
jgi:hypothetical protein